MNVIIVGCGKVGYSLAEALSAEGHDISVIDTADEPAQRLSNLDVSFIKGNGSSYRVLREAGVRDCDVLIAVTSRDEVNLLCCLVAKKAGNCRTVARVRNPEYYQEIDFIKDELGLSLSINPELATATYIYNLIRCPSAIDLSSFAKGRVQMFSMELPSNSGWIGKNLIQINAAHKYPLLISMVERAHQVLIPNGSTVLEKGDRISLLVPSESMGDTFRSIGVKTRPIKNVIIIGGGTTAYYLARRLKQANIAVTIIEYSRERCETLSELLPKTNIVWGNGANERLLLEEGLETADAVVALTNYDEENIMLALYANRRSRAKLITKVNKTNFNSVIEEMPIGSVVSPKTLTVETILRYARSMRTSPDSEMESVHKLADDRVEALSFRITGKSAVTDQTLAELRLRSGVLIGAIIRDNKVIIPSGQDMLLTGDAVIIVTTEKGIDSIKKILE